MSTPGTYSLKIIWLEQDRAPLIYINEPAGPLLNKADAFLADPNGVAAVDVFFGTVPLFRMNADGSMEELI